MDREARIGEGLALRAQEAYRLWAPSYDAENAVTVLEQQAVQELTPSLVGLSLLDAACGTGRRLPRAGAGGPARVVGIDLVFAMLTAGPRSNALLAVADLRALPCRSQSFDIVWCRLAVGHLADIDRLYAELARVARSGARIIVTDFHFAAARAGHTRTFRDAYGQLHTVEHFSHDLDAHGAAAQRAGLAVAAVREPSVGPPVRAFYEQADRLDAYERQYGLPLVLALALQA